MRIGRPGTAILLGIVYMAGANPELLSGNQSSTFVFTERDDGSGSVSIAIERVGRARWRRDFKLIGCLIEFVQSQYVIVRISRALR
ncbi:hypothetical protein NE236_14415 [Actinoallomurus purpureus]|nr:hypothetical protein [Actinoallomurus purpureus]